MPAQLIDALQGRVSLEESGFKHYGHAKRRSLKMKVMQMWVDHVLGLHVSVKSLHAAMDETVVSLLGVGWARHDEQLAKAVHCGLGGALIAARVLVALDVFTLVTHDVAALE